jgi:hypothetical protein
MGRMQIFHKEHYPKEYSIRTVCDYLHDVFNAFADGKIPQFCKTGEFGLEIQLQIL